MLDRKKKKLEISSQYVENVKQPHTCLYTCSKQICTMQNLRDNKPIVDIIIVGIEVVWTYTNKVYTNRPTSDM